MLRVLSALPFSPVDGIDVGNPRWFNLPSALRIHTHVQTPMESSTFSKDSWGGETVSSILYRSHAVSAASAYMLEHSMNISFSTTFKLLQSLPSSRPSCPVFHCPDDLYSADWTAASPKAVVTLVRLQLASVARGPCTWQQALPLDPL